MTYEIPKRMINARPKSRSTRITVKRHERHNGPSHIRRSGGWLFLPAIRFQPSTTPRRGRGGEVHDVHARRNVAKKWRSRGRGTDPCPAFEHARSEGNARGRPYVFRISCSLAEGLAALLARGRSGERGNVSSWRIRLSMGTRQGRSRGTDSKGDWENRRARRLGRWRFIGRVGRIGRIGRSPSRRSKSCGADCTTPRSLSMSR